MTRSGSEKNMRWIRHQQRHLENASTMQQLHRLTQQKEEAENQAPYNEPVALKEPRLPLR